MRGVLFAAAVVLAGSAQGLQAQDLTARAFLSRGEVGLNQQFVLNVQVQGTQQLDTEPELPDLSGFARYLGSGSSTNMQIVNRQTTVSITIQYRYQAVQEGTFEIGPVRLGAGGQTLTTEPLQLTVSASPQSGRSEATGDDPAGIGPEDLFVAAQASRGMLYENQPLRVEYRIYTRVNVSSYSVTEAPAAEGFWVEEIDRSEQPQVEQVVRNGQQYATAVIRELALFPTGPGSRTIEPLSIEARVRTQRRSDPLDTFFGRSSLFGSLEPVLVASDPVRVEVLPLPTDGRPASFNGLVGRLEISASLDRDRVEVGDAVTLTVEMTAEGNLRSLREPEIDFPRDFEVFPPEVTERKDTWKTGRKTYEYVLIPRAPGSRSIPSMVVSYFDAHRAQYATAATSALTLEVTGDPAGSPVSPVRGGIELLREDVRFIHIAPPKLRRVEENPFQGPLFWMVLLLPMAAAAGTLGLRRHWDRLEGDVAWARGRKAAPLARKRLKDARALVQSDDTSAFYGEVARALQHLLADKLNLGAAGLMTDSARDTVIERGVPPEVADEYLGCLRVCDRERFAPTGADAETRATFLERATLAISRLVEVLK